MGRPSARAGARDRHALDRAIAPASRSPETERSTHYMFCFARDFSIDDAEMSKLLFEGSKAVFLEDVAFLEAVQNNRADGSLDGLIHLTADAAQLQARRTLTTMISGERSE
jgi:Vanillate O-demethylase oxygenase C-terminal domain